jgi:hypothetical protein
MVFANGCTCLASLFPLAGVERLNLEEVQVDPLGRELPARAWGEWAGQHAQLMGLWRMAAHR